MKFAFFLIIFFSFYVQAETVKIFVPGMVCQMCVQGMQKQFKSTVKNPEQDVLVDLDTKMVTLKTISPITDEDIKQRVQNAGYNAEKIQRIDEKSISKGEKAKTLENKAIKKNKKS
jgi:copper chaperone CopZ